MRLLKFPSRFGPRIGAMSGDEIVDLALCAEEHLRVVQHIDEAIARHAARSVVPDDLCAFFATERQSVDEVSHLLDYVESCSEDHRESLRATGVLTVFAGQPLLPPLGREARVFLVGLNYDEHLKEGGRARDLVPGIFVRTHASLVGHRQSLVRPHVSAELDWETELAVVIGRPGRYIDRSDALRHVGGFAILNDGSVRDYQHRARHITAGKNFDRSGSMGPWIRTRDPSIELQDLDISMELNGETMQSANTAEMIFDIATLIAHISEFTTLSPGDVISTGSPAGVGHRRNPPRFLRPGDFVRFSIEHVGEMEHDVRDEHGDEETRY